jgi:hypothetical protein
MSDVKLVCYDLDGTINDGWNLLPALKIKMNKLRKAGVKQAIITGREAVGTLYFVHNCQFEFDFVGCGGGPVIVEPLRKPLVVDLFDETVLGAVTKSGLSKTGRLLKVMELCGVTGESTLFIDDNNNRSLDVNEVNSKTDCLLASPKSNNDEWLKVVKDRNGIISERPCGYGTFEILQSVFG